MNSKQQWSQMKIFTQHVVLLAALSIAKTYPASAMTRKSASIAPAPLSQKTNTLTIPTDAPPPTYHPEVVAETLPGALLEHSPESETPGQLRVDPKLPELSHRPHPTHSIPLYSQIQPKTQNTYPSTIPGSTAEYAPSTQALDLTELTPLTEKPTRPHYLRYYEFPEKYRDEMF